MDVLRRIFEILRDTSRPVNSHPVFESLQWITEVTHVCRSWRDAALSARYLWTNINVAASISWAPEFARRSGDAPICVLVHRVPNRPGHPKLHECMKALLQENMQRIWKILFHDFDGAEENLIMSALSDGTQVPFYTILRHLDISFKSKSSILLSNDGIRAPELERLSLTHCSVEVEFGSFRNLSHLSISNSSSPIIRPDGLRRVLSQTPKLETLVLQPNYLLMDASTVPTVDSDGTHPQAVILPNLIHIDISGRDIEWASAILQVISYGPQRNLLVHSGRGRHAEQILSLFTSTLLHATMESSSISRLKLSIATFSLVALFLEAWRGPYRVQPDIKFSILALHDLNLSNLMVGLLRRMDYRSLQILQLNSVQPLSTRLWVELFGSLPWLMMIEISQGEREFFGALIAETGDLNIPLDHLSVGSSHTTLALPFRALKVIRLIERRELYPEDDVEFMLGCLAKRLDLGMGLEGIFFQLYNYQELKSQVEPFKEVVEVMKIVFDDEPYPPEE